MTIRIIGTTKGNAHKVEEPKSKIRWYIIALAALLCIIAGVLLLLPRHNSIKHKITFFRGIS